MWFRSFDSQLLKGAEFKGPQHTSGGHLLQPQGRDEVLESSRPASGSILSTIGR